MKFRRRYLITAILIVWLCFALVPIYWMVSLSFKGSLEANTQLTFFPRQFTTDNYVQVLSSWPWVRSILQTLGYALLNTLIVVCVAVPGAYAFTRWDFRGRNVVLFWLLLNRHLQGLALPHRYLSCRIRRYLLLQFFHS